MGGPEEHAEGEESKERKDSRREGSPRGRFRQACSGWARRERSRGLDYISSDSKTNYSPKYL